MMRCRRARLAVERQFLDPVEAAGGEGHGGLGDGPEDDVDLAVLERTVELELPVGLARAGEEEVASLGADGLELDRAGRGVVGDADADGGVAHVLNGAKAELVEGEAS